MTSQQNPYFGYFDYAAATPVDTRVSEYVDSIADKSWGNPNAFHASGRASKALLENARETVASTINCKSNQIIFVPSATIANNLALKGSVKSSKNIITSNNEHSSVENQLDQKNCKINVDNKTQICWEQVLPNIQKSTELLSLIWVNNVTGAVTDVQKISEKLQILNQERIANGLNKVLFHIDAVQAPNYLQIDLEILKVDFLTLSSQKIYAPRGAAVLYARDKSTLNPIIHGGGQESGLWSGTPNVAAICGFAKALEIAQNEIEITKEQHTIFRQKIIEFVNNNSTISIIPDSFLDNGFTVPGILYLSIENRNTEELLTYFDLHSIQISAGSACASGAVITSNFIPKTNAGMRISIGRFTTIDDMQLLITILTSFLKHG